MNENIAIELFKRLSKDEIRLLGDFVCSAYFNSNKNLIKIYKVIAGSAPGFTGRNLKKEALFKKIYPGKPFNEGTLRTRMSEFAAIIREFLVYEEFKDDKNNRSDYLAAAYKKKNMNTDALKVIDKNISAAGEDSKFYSDYFDRMFKLSDERKMHVYTGGDYYKTLEGLYHMLDYNIYRFLLRFISIKTEMIAFEKIYNVKRERTLSDLVFENFNIEKFIAYMELKNIKHNELFRIYYDSMMALIHVEDGKYRDKVKNHIFNMHENFNKYELYNFWCNFILACNLAVDKNKSAIYRDNFEVTKFIIEKGVFPLHEDGYLLDGEYRNIISAAVRVKEYDWAEEFAEKFKDTLIPDVRGKSYLMVKAKCRFYKKDYEGCISYLSRISTTDVIGYLDIKLFHFMSYFELGYFEQADSVIDALRHYVAENKSISELSKLDVPLFIKYASALSKAKFSKTKVGYDSYRELEDGRWFTMKGWITEKVKEYLE